MTEGTPSVGLGPSGGWKAGFHQAGKLVKTAISGIQGHNVKSNPPAKQGGVRQSGIDPNSKVKIPLPSLSKLTNTITQLKIDPNGILNRIQKAVKDLFIQLQQGETKNVDIVIERKDDAPAKTQSSSGGEAKVNQGTPEMRFWRASNPIGDSTFFNKAENEETEANFKLLQGAIRDMAKESKDPFAGYALNNVEDLSQELSSVWSDTQKLGLENCYEGAERKSINKGAYKNLTPEQRKGLIEARKQLLEIKKNAASMTEYLKANENVKGEVVAPMGLEAHADKMLNEVNRLLGLPTQEAPQRRRHSI